MLTKAQKEMLQLMRDKGAYISHWIHGVKYVLCLKDDSRLKSIRINWMWVLKPFFIEQHKSGYATTLYYLKEDAEITDEWLQAEIDKIKQAKQQKEDEEQRQKAFKDVAANNYMNVGPGPFQVLMSGNWPFGGGIYFKGEKIADIHAIHYSTRDNDFEDVLKREENIPHFEAIKELVRRA